MKKFIEIGIFINFKLEIIKPPTMRKYRLIPCLILSAIIFISNVTTAQRVIKVNINSSKQSLKGKAQNIVPDPAQLKKIAATKDSLLQLKNILIQNLTTIYNLNSPDTALRIQIVQNINNQFQKTIDSLEKSQQNEKNNENEDSATTGCQKFSTFSDMVVEKNDEGGFDFILVDKKENPLNSFTIMDPNEELVRDKLTKAISGLCDEMSDSMRIVAAGIVDNLLKRGLYVIILEASRKINSDDVLAGKLYIMKTAKVSYYKLDSIEYKSIVSGDSTKEIRKKRKKIFIDPPFTVYNIQIQFQDGFIENIKVTGKMEGLDTTLIFENSFPFAFSNKTNFQKLYKRKLYEVTILKKNKAYMLLGSLIRYNYELRQYTRDYFPENQVYKAIINDSITIANLYREKTTQILAVKVFSDLKGANTENPNGLIQTEFSRTFNLLTQRIDLGRGLNIGFLNYYLPAFELNKIENNEKYLVLDHYEKNPSSTGQPNPLGSTLDIYQHQIYSTGVGLNLFLIDLPNLKSTFNFCGGVYYGRTAIQDTLREFDQATSQFVALKDNNVVIKGFNTFQIAPEIKWQIFPDERYGVILSYKFRYFYALQDYFQQVREKKDYVSFAQNSVPNDTYKYKKWICTPEIFAFFKPSQTNELFFRYRLNYDIDHIQHNFSQLQVGLTTYLTSTKKKKTE